MKNLAALVPILALVVLSTTLPTRAQQEVNEGERFVNMMSKYLDMTDQLIELTARPEAAVYQAIEGVVEVYRLRGETGKAIEYLSEVLDDADNQTIRNLLHLKLRELYQETGRSQEALEQLKKMIDENLELAP